MSHPPEPPDPQPQEPHPLDYATTESNRPPDGMSYGGQVGCGCGSFVAAVLLGSLLVNIFGAASHHYDGLPFVAGFGVSFGLLACLAVLSRTRWQCKGFLVGILIALGLVLLAAGLCAVLIFAITR